MARYIDVETALKIIDNYAKTVTADGIVVVKAIRDIVEIITPTADVVPKSEVEKLVQDGTRLGQENETLKDNNEHLAVMLEETKAEVGKLQNGLMIWKQNRFNLFQRLECYEMARQKVASEIFAEIEKVLQNEIKQYDDLFHETEDPRFKQEYICANNALEWASIKIIELKKKYTEGEQ